MSTPMSVYEYYKSYTGTALFTTTIYPYEGDTGEACSAGDKQYSAEV